MKETDQKFLTTKQLPEHTGLSTSFFEKGRVYGYGPPYIRIRSGSRSGKILYRLADVALDSIKWIVLHSMEAGEASSTAENVAAWFAGSSAPMASAHFCIDNDSIVQCVRVRDVAYHAPGASRHGIGLEHAGYARQSPDEWADPYSAAMLARSAKLAAYLADLCGIPVEYVDREGLKAGKPGFTTHNEVTYAFRKSTHTDPGKGFPMDSYLDAVRAAA